MKLLNFYKVCFLTQTEIDKVKLLKLASAVLLPIISPKMHHFLSCRVLRWLWWNPLSYSAWVKHKKKKKGKIPQTSNKQWGFPGHSRALFKNFCCDQRMKIHNVEMFFTQTIQRLYWQNSLNLRIFFSRLYWENTRLRVDLQVRRIWPY